MVLYTTKTHIPKMKNILFRLIKGNGTCVLYILGILSKNLKSPKRGAHALPGVLGLPSQDVEHTNPIISGH